MSEMVRLRSAHTIFHSTRGHLKRKKALKLLATPQTALGALPAPSWCGFLPFSKTSPPVAALRTSRSTLRASQLLLLNEGPSDPCYTTGYTQKKNSFCFTRRGMARLSWPDSGLVDLRTVTHLSTHPARRRVTSRYDQRCHQ